MWGEDLLSEIIDTLIAEIPKANNGPIPPYRMSLYLGFFFKFYVKIRSSLEMICVSLTF